ncbi:MAG: hypothetical protein Q9207_003474 [Kuettlingeria erythrocarpa]
MARIGTIDQRQQEQRHDVWTQMGYVPPRGPCAQKLSMISSCPCFRFMLNPLKASTSFECDGCGHHASFHKMDNREDEETVRYWKERQTDNDTMRSLMMRNDARMDARAGLQARTRREIENRITEDSDDSLQPIEDIVEVPRPVSKKRRTGAR